MCDVYQLFVDIYLAYILIFKLIPDFDFGEIEICYIIHKTV